MSAGNLKPRNATTGPRRWVSACASGLALDGATFQASLTACAQGAISPGKAMESLLPLREVKCTRWQAICSDALTRAWSFLHAKYKTSTTKRLHVAETISLGEKRFVAIVKVEGQEFLIGGGVSGMSLLAELGKTSRSPRAPRKKIADSGGML